MAVFNLDYYCGKDLYSDGSVEDLIAGIVGKDLDYTDFAGTDGYFAVMYHLSPERENILNWYPFHKSDSILEAGGGCGAVTGLLCEKAGWVTSVELSKKRAGINYARHRDYKNLEIIAGNLNEIELERTYDYVVLNGVFEYAAGFSESSAPYEEFLNNVKKHLKKDGKILIAIENRLGVKYFSGAPEDHTGEYYGGINGYRNCSSVRTFSKAELEEIFRKCGIGKWKFYYPYPDYKFPLEIFTDENVNSPNYGRVYRNYQKGKVEIFNEQDMVLLLKKENAMGSFSNSFLAELCIGAAEPSSTAYAKLSSARKRKYRISTVIEKRQEGYAVTKSALDEKAAGHIESIYANQKKELPAGFAYLQGGLKDGRIAYPYLEGGNLDSCFLTWMLEGEREKIKAHIDRIYHSLMDRAAWSKDFYGEDFKACFGSERCSGPMACVKDGNIDLILDNLFWTGESYLVIDPEWAFDFWVPAEFIFWRMLNEWYSKYKPANELLPQEQLHEAYGITEELVGVFKSWIVHFASYFVSDVDMDECAEWTDAVDIDCVLKEQAARNTISSALYLDYGEGFSEKEKSICQAVVKDGRFHMKFAFDSTRKLWNLRWDPADGRFCKCRAEECYLDGQAAAVYPLNADSADKSVFLNTDPQFGIELEPGNYGRLEISGTFQYLEEGYIAQRILKAADENAALRGENEKLQAELNMIKNSRGWKVLCFLRKILKRSH